MVLTLFMALGAAGVLVYPFWGISVQGGWEEMVHLGSSWEAVESLPSEVFWVWVDEAAAVPISCRWCSCFKQRVGGTSRGPFLCFQGNIFCHNAKIFMLSNQVPLQLTGFCSIWGW